MEENSKAIPSFIEPEFIHSGGILESEKNKKEGINLFFTSSANNNNNFISPSPSSTPTLSPSPSSSISSLNHTPIIPTISPINKNQHLENVNKNFSVMDFLPTNNNNFIFRTSTPNNNNSSSFFLKTESSFSPANIYEDENSILNNMIIKTEVDENSMENPNNISNISAASTSSLNTSSSSINSIRRTRAPSKMYQQSENILVPSDSVIANALSSATGVSNNNGSNSPSSVFSATTTTSLVETLNSDSKDKKYIKGCWTEEEDRLLVELVAKYGAKKWAFIASQLPNSRRIGKQCRERYLNHLDPNVKKDVWTPEEDRIVLEMHAKLGNQWAQISKMLPGRTANAVKNHWNSTIRRKMEKLNIDLQSLEEEVRAASLVNGQVAASSSSVSVSASIPITKQENEDEDEEDEIDNNDNDNVVQNQNQSSQQEKVVQSFSSNSTNAQVSMRAETPSEFDSKTNKKRKNKIDQDDEKEDEFDENEEMADEDGKKKRKNKKNSTLKKDDKKPQEKKPRKPRMKKAEKLRLLQEQEETRKKKELQNSSAIQLDPLDSKLIINPETNNIENNNNENLSINNSTNQLISNLPSSSEMDIVIDGGFELENSFTPTNSFKKQKSTIVTISNHTSASISNRINTPSNENNNEFDPNLLFHDNDQTTSSSVSNTQNNNNNNSTPNNSVHKVEFLPVISHSTTPPPTITISNNNNNNNNSNNSNSNSTNTTPSNNSNNSLHSSLLTPNFKHSNTYVFQSNVFPSPRSQSFLQAHNQSNNVNNNNIPNINNLNIISNFNQHSIDHSITPTHSSSNLMLPPLLPIFSTTPSNKTRNLRISTDFDSNFEFHEGVSPFNFDHGNEQTNCLDSLFSPNANSICPGQTPSATIANIHANSQWERNLNNSSSIVNLNHHSSSH